MSTICAALPFARLFDFSGLPLAGGLVYTYQARSTTPLPTYRDLGGITANPNPIVLDTTGSAVVRFLPQAYKIVVLDATGTTTLYSQDDYYPPFTNVADVAAALNPQTSLEAAAAITPSNYSFPPGHLHRYGAVGDNATDDSLAVAAAFSTGHLVTGEAGRTYFLGSSTLTLATPTQAQLHGVAFRTAVFGITCLKIATGDVSIAGLELYGRTGAAFTANERLIDWSGTDVNHYLVGLTLTDCYFHDSGQECFWSQFGEKGTLNNCRFENYAYAGAHVLSGLDWLFNGGEIDAGSPVGANGNAYGVSFTRDPTVNDDLAIVPRSKNCIVQGMKIKNNPLWSALDTHGGEEIIFANNVVENCKFGVTIGPCPNMGGVETFAPKNCISIGNRLTGVSGGGGFGVSIVGAGTVTGSVTDWAAGCASIGDVIYNFGVAGSSTSGGIVCYNTWGTIVSGACLFRCHSNGIVMYHDNSGFTITGGSITDPYSNTLTDCSGIRLDAGYNTGVINGVSLLKADASIATTVAARGINMVVSSNSTVRIGPHYNSMTADVVGVPGFPITALTDSTGGVVSTTIADVGGSFNQTTLNSRFASVTSAINSIETALRNAGMIG